MKMFFAGTFRSVETKGILPVGVLTALGRRVLLPGSEKRSLRGLHEFFGNRSISSSKIWGPGTLALGVTRPPKTWTSPCEFLVWACRRLTGSTDSALPSNSWATLRYSMALGCAAHTRGPILPHSGPRKV